MRNYTLQTQVYTLEDYMGECCCTMSDVEYLYGKFVKCFIWALLEDSTTGYVQRLFAPVYVDTMVGHAQAIQQVTLDLLQDYFASSTTQERKLRKSYTKRSTT